MGGSHDKGATILNDFFKKTLQEFMVPDLSSLGKKIIDCTLSNGTVKDYESLLGEPTIVE